MTELYEAAKAQLIAQNPKWEGFDDENEKFILGVGGKIQYKVYVKPMVDSATTVQIIVPFIQGIPTTQENEIKMSLLCNGINRHFRWIKMCYEDGELTVYNDDVVNIDTVGDEIIECAKRIVLVCDDMYAEVQKAIWS